jgi:methylmalonyl-CoA/ethylmalonyl-CoA epimerase
MGLPYLEFNHVCIIVRDIKQSSKNWMTILGVTEEDCLFHDFDVVEEDARITVCNIPAGNGFWVQLVQPLDDKGGMAGFLAKRGEGVQHMGFVCPESRMGELDSLVREKTTFKWLFPEPRGPVGEKYSMIHPKSANGIIIETLTKGWDNDIRRYTDLQVRQAEHNAAKRLEAANKALKETASKA